MEGILFDLALCSCGFDPQSLIVVPLLQLLRDIIAAPWCGCGEESWTEAGQV
jgi:hypothetical protein